MTSESNKVVIVGRDDSTVKVDIKTFPGARVVLKKNLTVAEIRKVQTGKSDKTDFEQGLDILLSSIVERNFADKEEKTLPINLDSIDYLPIDEVNKLMEIVMENNKMAKDPKKA